MDPAIFDGIITGAPSFDFTSMMDRADCTLQALGFNDNTIDAYMTKREAISVSSLIFVLKLQTALLPYGAVNARNIALVT
jgi:hypothetical protein